MAGQGPEPGSSIGSQLVRVVQELIEAVSQPPVLGALILLALLLVVRLILTPSGQV
jgi:hypothetical protein